LVSLEKLETTTHVCQKCRLLEARHKDRKLKPVKVKHFRNWTRKENPRG
jgi:hypothetical protein